MTLIALGKLAHVVAALWLVAGLAGRTLALSAARKADEIGTLQTLTDLAGRFDRLFVIPGSQLVLVLGLATAWIGGFPILGFLQGAHSNWLLVSLAIYIGITALVPTIFLPSGKAFDRALEDARVDAAITPALHEALNNRRVGRAHQVELVGIAAIVFLMVMKPF